MSTSPVSRQTRSEPSMANPYLRKVENFATTKQAIYLPPASTTAPSVKFIVQPKVWFVQRSAPKRNQKKFSKAALRKFLKKQLGSGSLECIWKIQKMGKAAIKTVAAILIEDYLGNANLDKKTRRAAAEVLGFIGGYYYMVCEVLGATLPILKKGNKVSFDVRRDAIAAIDRLTYPIKKKFTAKEISILRKVAKYLKREVRAGIKRRQPNRKNKKLYRKYLSQQELAVASASVLGKLGVYGIFSNKVLMAGLKAKHYPLQCTCVDAFRSMYLHSKRIDKKIVNALVAALYMDVRNITIYQSQRVWSKVAATMHSLGPMMIRSSTKPVEALLGTYKQATKNAPEMASWHYSLALGSMFVNAKPKNMSKKMKKLFKKSKSFLHQLAVSNKTKVFGRRHSTSTAVFALARIGRVALPELDAIAKLKQKVYKQRSALAAKYAKVIRSGKAVHDLAYIN